MSGRRWLFAQIPRNPRTIEISQLAADINDGRIKQLFILGGDPVYNAPRGLAQDRKTRKLPLDWADLQKKVPEVVRLGYHEDATSALSQWHVPTAHYPGIMGRRAHCRGRLLVDPADDSCRSSADFRKSSFSTPCSADRKLKDRSWCRKRSAPQIRLAIFKLRGRVSFTMVLQRMFSRVISPRPSMRIAGAAAESKSVDIAAGTDARFTRDCADSAVIRWTMAVTLTTAGFRNYPIPSRSLPGTMRR